MKMRSPSQEAKAPENEVAFQYFKESSKKLLKDHLDHLNHVLKALKQDEEVLKKEEQGAKNAYSIGVANDDKEIRRLMALHQNLLAMQEEIQSCSKDVEDHLSKIGKASTLESVLKQNEDIQKNLSLDAERKIEVQQGQPRVVQPLNITPHIIKLQKIQDTMTYGTEDQIKKEQFRMATINLLNKYLKSKKGFFAKLTQIDLFDRTAKVKACLNELEDPSKTQTLAAIEKLVVEFQKKNNDATEEYNKPREEPRQNAMDDYQPGTTVSIPKETPAREGRLAKALEAHLSSYHVPVEQYKDTKKDDVDAGHPRKAQPIKPSGM
jgi:hypothetical protein